MNLSLTFGTKRGYLYNEALEALDSVPFKSGRVARELKEWFTFLIKTKFNIISSAPSIGKQRKIQFLKYTHLIENIIPLVPKKWTVEEAEISDEELEADVKLQYIDIANKQLKIIEEELDKLENNPSNYRDIYYSESEYTDSLEEWCKEQRIPEYCYGDELFVKSVTHVGKRIYKVETMREEKVHIGDSHFSFLKFYSLVNDHMNCDIIRTDNKFDSAENKKAKSIKMALKVQRDQFILRDIGLALDTVQGRFMYKIKKNDVCKVLIPGKTSSDDKSYLVMYDADGKLCYHPTSFEVPLYKKKTVYETNERILYHAAQVSTDFYNHLVKKITDVQNFVVSENTGTLFVTSDWKAMVEYQVSPDNPGFYIKVRDAPKNPIDFIPMKFTPRRIRVTVVPAVEHRVLTRHTKRVREQIPFHDVALEIRKKLKDKELLKKIIDKKEEWTLVKKKHSAERVERSKQNSIVCINQFDVLRYDKKCHNRLFKLSKEENILQDRKIEKPDGNFSRRNLARLRNKILNLNTVPKVYQMEQKQIRKNFDVKSVEPKVMNKYELLRLLTMKRTETKNTEPLSLESVEKLGKKGFVTKKDINLKHSLRRSIKNLFNQICGKPPDLSLVPLRII